MKILLSGGHLTPALAFIDYTHRHQTGDTLVFIGRAYSQEKLQQKSQEMKEVTARGVEFELLGAPRLQYLGPLEILKLGWRSFSSIFAAIGLFRKHQPDVFLSFGGYMAVPLAIAAFMLRIPIVTHEQTQTAGFANTLISRLATKIAVAYPAAQSLFPKHKTVVTGNLLRPALISPADRSPSWIGSVPLPLLYVTGGNQGSEILNTTIMQALPQLTRSWFVIHQCGNPTLARNYLQELEAARSKLSVRAQKMFVIREWISDIELGWIYKHADCVIARAGANTVHELTALAIPSILVPLPFSHRDEQTINAKIIADQNGAILLPQKELNPHSLLINLEKVQKAGKSMRHALKGMHIEKNGDELLYQVVKQVVPIT